MTDGPNLPFRFHVPSGRFAGPTEKPFLSFCLFLLVEMSSASSRGRLGAISQMSTSASEEG